MGIIKFLSTKFRISVPTHHKQKQSDDDSLRLKKNLKENIQRIKQTFGNSEDIVVREWRTEGSNAIEVAVIYADGLADVKLINQFIIEPLMSLDRYPHFSGLQSPAGNYLDEFKQLLLPVGSIQEGLNLDMLLSGILSGETVLLCQGFDQGLLIASKGWEDRPIQEPTSQTVIRGPKDGFTENIITNIALVRRKIKDPNLWIQGFNVGRITKTSVSIVYVNGIAKDHVVQEVRDRIGRIQIDGILESGYIEELIQDRRFTLFPTIYNTERPDVIAAGLLEGRIAILVDGTPFVLLVPAIFPQFFQSAEDYYQRSDISTLLRLLRYSALLIALLGPPLYIAITTFHHDMLPPRLLISLSAQREGIPFPAFFEALIMELTFELLREAGVRLPRAVGQSISIVGALVIGQAAVQAGIVSAAMVIVVSITAIASFTIPAYNMAIAIRILRFGIMGLAASFGLFGIIAGIIAIVQHLCHLNSFGVPYMSPYAPVVTEDLKDGGLRVPWWKMNSRPSTASKLNQIRQSHSSTTDPDPEGRD
ncbi:spore germination protein [Paenibacillus sp. Root444D2]|uniref:spore germination protein n=1 Tax=Paenibacillus sp. Root444D2 TaxID=1736538 RepID=UPI00070FAA77|nr:spore germination protein [Paenibacillus sp. Root444D2]KQX61139.1 spore gernimation protein KA [Paenibacillus sp. Root444D2]